MAGKADNTKNQVKEITDRLEQGVKDLFSGDKYLTYLQTMSRFRRYSTRNTLLIYMQKPDATLVAGYQAWQSKFGRYVKKGEKGIKILAPTPFTIRKEQQKLDPDTRMPILDASGLPVTEEVEVRIARFKVIPVFDLSQTDGKPLPSLVEDLVGDVKHYEVFLEALRTVSPLPIRFEPLEPGTDGLCRMGDRISIREGMSEIQTISAVIHEITHAKLHDPEHMLPEDETAKPKDRRTEEVEAESVSYAVCQYYGIETAVNSFGYLAEWSKTRELKELNASLDTIRKTAAELIDSIDENFRALAKERGISLDSQQRDEAIEAPVSAPDVPVPLMEEPGPFPDKPEKQYELGYGHMGNGLTVWNRLEEQNGDYVTVAHIGADRSVTFYDMDMPETVKAEIEKTARTSEMSVSGTQDMPVFSVPPIPDTPEVPEPNQEPEAADPVHEPASAPEPEQAASDGDNLLPDPSIGLSERDLYGYTDPTMLPLLIERAQELFDADHTIYMLYPDNTEAMVFDREEIAGHDGIFGMEAEEWQTSREFEQRKNAARNSEASREADLLYGSGDRFGIYQLKDGDALHFHRFTSLKQLEQDGLTVDRSNYELVYTAPLAPEDTLEGIFERFNLHHPADFYGHSLSVSDVVCLQQNGMLTSHYVDSVGFQELPSFIGNEGLDKTYSQSGNRPEHSEPEPTSTVAELEAQVKAGKQISLFDLANAVKKDAEHSRRKEKPSILARLQEGKKAAQGMETSKSAPKRGSEREV